MAPDTSDMAAFLNPALCANTEKNIDGEAAPCQAHAALACGSCNLVQYGSKDCQVADWQRHKKTCKSPFMKDTWVPDWYSSGRVPTFIGNSSVFTPFGAKKFLWGNIPALDVLQLKDNEDNTDITRNFNLLFAASGDLRNVVKTIVGLPEGYQGECMALLNDKKFIVVARNSIMLLVALQFEPDIAVPMIIHLWYSALLPSAILHAIQSRILPFVDDVCKKIKDKPDGSMQAKTFNIRERRLRIVLNKEDWTRLAKFCQVPEGLTAEKAQSVRRRVALAPERLDYRERSMLQWPKAVRQGETHFRDTGVLLPYGCSTTAFDTPNPTLFSSGVWSMKDHASPRDGWFYSEYMKNASAAKADEFGAIFFHMRDLLVKFCHRLHSRNISFQLFSMDARDLGSHVENMKFDRIEISNICDTAFMGPHTCLQVFSPLLKPKSQNPKATLLLLFLNAAVQTESICNPHGDRSALELARKRLQKYIPLDLSTLSLTRDANNARIPSPDLIMRTSCYDMFKNWDKYFEAFLRELEIAKYAKLCGLTIKKKHTIVQAWPYLIGVRSTKEEFDILRASGIAGWERYVEIESVE